MRRTIMKTTTWIFGLALAGLAGCAGEPSSSDSVAVAQLDGVGGCEHITLPAHAKPTLHAVAGVEDLFLVRSDGQDLCADSAAGAAQLFALERGPSSGHAASNPMPGSNPYSSNPMPGTDPFASNPMPGTDPGTSNPAASNPMPGTDPMVAANTTKHN